MFQSIVKHQLQIDIPQGLIVFNVFTKDHGNDTKHIQRKMTPNLGELLIHWGVGATIQRDIAKMEKWFNRNLMKGKVLMKDSPGSGHGTCHGLADKVMISQSLDSIISETFSNLNDSVNLWDGKIPNQKLAGGQCYGTALQKQTQEFWWPITWTCDRRLSL